MKTLWHLSRLKQRICFAFLPVISNALKLKCKSQSTDSEHKMLLVEAQYVWNAYWICRIQIAYRNCPVFIHVERKTIIYIQALALVMYTWVENVAIYLFKTGIWQNLFICTFFFDCFSTFYTFHDAWAHTASMPIFPTSACLLKPVGIDVQTSNTRTRNICFVFTSIFTIHGYYFRILYLDLPWFMWKRVEYVG